MFSSAFIVALVFQTIRGQPCADVNSVYLGDGRALSDGSFVKDGVTYERGHVYRKNVSGELKILGCMCQMRPCFRKCCPLGSVMVDDGSCKSNPQYDLITTRGLTISYKTTLMKNVDVLKSGFDLVYGMPCHKENIYMEDDRDWYLQEDGTLYVTAPNDNPPWHVEDINHYCIDTFIMEDSVGDQSTKLDAFLCFAIKQDDRSHYVVSSSCMLISCVFILMTVAVYAWLPELRNLHGKVLMAYLLCFFVGFLFMSTMQILLYKDEIPEVCCTIFTFIIYFALESAFFWLNVMCFDIWWTFSGKRGLSLAKLSSQARFLAYAMYAFGIPTALTILLASLEFSGLPSHSLLPKIRDQACFLYGHSRLLYLYGPILILIVANILFFILTAVKIAQIKKQTSVLKSKESSTHDPRSKDKQRLILYLKLFAVMGINWILEVISALYPKAQGIWIYTDAFNVLIGVTVFVVFVCKPKIFRLIKKRYKQVRGDPMSRTVTSISARTMSIKEDMQMTSVKSK